MKFITLFFVLSLVVLMAEPGEGFFHHIISGIIHVGKAIHGAIHGKDLQEQQAEQQRLEQQQLEQQQLEQQMALD
ncbi:moronecidin-like [Mastacembelus armatus]|uniref:moronecidin-like n=1 Tax=Mastacembelus armatus TaxID=205130 RepID=UPI000E4647C5|nr:moronecidin-like [Mastacembelus armatus]